MEAGSVRFEMSLVRRGVDAYRTRALPPSSHHLDFVYLYPWSLGLGILEEHAKVWDDPS